MSDNEEECDDAQSLGGICNVIERNRVWAENKNRKIEMIKEQVVDKDIDECTFQPRINKKNAHKRQISTGGCANELY
jgi:hypothetical protein